MNETNDDALSEEREFCKRTAGHDLRSKKELRTALDNIIEAATSVEQLHEIGNAIVHAMLVNNPRLYRQLPNGNWVLTDEGKREADCAAAKP
jgi:hypothetical protein